MTDDKNLELLCKNCKHESHCDEECESCANEICMTCACPKCEEVIEY